MEAATKVFTWLGGVATLFVIVSGLWYTSQIFATDVELAAVAAASETTTKLLEEKHDRDKVTAEEARKNDRIDRVDRDIRKLRKEIEFGPINQKAYNEAELAELLQLKQNIIEGHR